MVRDVAVIGAGLCGLAAAHALIEAGARVTLYERSSRPGGNADTRVVTLGDRRVDLGVSDLNRRTYLRTWAAVERFGVRTRPMHTSTGFASDDGEITYVLGRRHGAPPPADVLTELRRFRLQAYAAAEGEDGRLPLDAWLAAHGYSARFADLYLRPRVHALWFCGEAGPGALPMRAIMRFYALQEGFVADGEPRPERRYLEEGAGALVDALLNALPEGTLRKGVSPRVIPGGRPRVHDGAEANEFDAVILATPADEGARILDGADELAAVLAGVPYQDTEVVAHTDARLLGPNPNAWGSFNARIQPRYEGPYTVTSVVNLHQHDAEHPERSRAVQPVSFTTANPWRPIPDALVLRTSDGAPARRVFHHNVMDARALAAADALPALQGRRGVWVCAGWSVGVGLMEDLWTAAERVASAVRTARRATH